MFDSTSKMTHLSPLISIMKKWNFLYLIICTINIVTLTGAQAQTATGDTTAKQKALSNAVAFFDSSIGDQSSLYNGPEYNFYDPIYKGTAYFMDVNAFTPGSLHYDGVLYKNVPMLYDLYADKVVVLLYNHFSKFSLLSERLKSFDFLDHHFINIAADSTSANSVVSPGFYDELYVGKVQVLVKRVKNIQNNPGTTTIESYFNPVTSYYLRKDNVYYSISGEGSFLSVLKDKKDALKQYIKANKIKFRKTPEEAMVKIASYYDHLTN